MPKKLPKIITQEEFEKLFSETIKIEKKVSRKKKPRIRQYRLAMLLGFEAGMRISEIVGLKPHIPPLQKSNIHYNYIKVFGKGGRERIVPKPKRMNKQAIAMLPLNLKRRMVQRFFTDLGESILGRHITFHTLRHGFGSHLAGSGRPLHEIQMMMGHSRLDTTGIYLHANPKQTIEKAMEVF